MKRKMAMAVSLFTAAILLLSSLPAISLFAGAAAETRTRTASPPTLSGPLDQATDVILKTDPDTFTNPVNISYQYQPEYQSRESADPAIVLYKNEYYLFASHGSGYWWSDNLTDWNYVYALDSDNLIPSYRNGQNDFERFAPATMVIGDYLYITCSEGGAIFKSNNPKDPGSWVFVRDAVDNWGDPALFYDEELDRAFCYFGTSGDQSQLVVELDPHDNMKLLAGPIPTVGSNLLAHGFEVQGDNNEKYNDGPCIEGDWMNKYDGKYYLQFASPGTENGSYADGCAVSDDPLGPFTFCINSPVSYKATGFVRGAGHGCTFQDKYGNWWKADTVSISTNTGFERRLALYPAAFNEYGELVTNTAFSDYPMYKPEMTEFSLDDPGPGWNLVSYNPKTVTASSTLPPGPPNANENKTLSFAPANAFDENIKDWWSAATGNAGEWIEADLGKVTAVNAFQINFADQGVTTRGVITPENGRLNDFCYQYIAEFSTDGNTWHTLLDKSGAVARPKMAEDYSHPYFELGKTIGVRYIRVTNKGSVPLGGKFALSGIRLFGNGQGTAPAKAGNLTVARPADDERQATVTWDAVPGAEGYILRYGCHEDSRYIHYQVIGTNSVTVRNLNKGVDYYFTVDAYNDSGVTKGTAMQYAPFTLPAPDPLVFLRATINNLHSPGILASTGVPAENGTGGVFIESFQDGSYAPVLGLKLNDVILKINGADVKDTRTFLALYGAIPDGGTAALTVWRKNRYVDVTFTKEAKNDYLMVPCVIQAEAFDDKQGKDLNSQGCGDIGGGSNIGSINSGDWVKYSHINFVQSPTSVTFRAAKNDGDPMVISLRLDSPTGKALASVTVPPMGDWQKYYDFPAEITDTIEPGLHDVYLTFTSSVNVNWFSLNVEEKPDPYPAYEVARFSDFEGKTVVSGGASLWADWKYIDGKTPVDLTAHDPDKLFLRVSFTLSASETDVDLTNAFVSGDIKLRSPDAVKDNDPDSKPGDINQEHNFGWTITPAWGLHIGENYLDIPLADAINGVYKNGAAAQPDVKYGVNNKRGIIDWTQVERIFMNINSIQSAPYAGITYTLNISEARIVDTTFEEEQAALLAVVNGDPIPRGDYTDASYNAYLAARDLARLELEAADTITEMHETMAALQAAIDGLTEGGGDAFVRGDVNSDGKIDTVDARLILQHIVGKTDLAKLNDTASEAADVNRDGKIDTVDARLVLQLIVGKITSFD